MDPRIAKKLSSFLRKAGFKPAQSKAVIKAILNFLDKVADKPPQTNLEIVENLMDLLAPITIHTGLPVLDLAKDMLECSRVFPESTYGIPAYAINVMNVAEATFGTLLVNPYPDQGELAQDLLVAIYRLKATFLIASLLLTYVPNGHEILPHVTLDTIPLSAEDSMQLDSGTLSLNEFVQKYITKDTKASDKSSKPITKKAGFDLDLSKLNELYERYKKPSPN